jgi:phage-related protein
MATFTYIPDRPATETSTPRVNQVRLGAYEQRLVYGINPFRDTWSLRFSNRSTSDATDILDFLKARDGQETFEWETPFGETAQFICAKWSASLDSCNFRSINAEFELRYEAGETNIAIPAGTATTFTWIPDFTATQEYESNVRTVNFGDGYTQRLKFGLNPQQEIWSLEFRNRTNTERDQIRTFLRQARVQTAFTWTDPLTSSTGKYVCAEWSTRYNNHNNNDIQASFRRVFEPS